MQADHAGTADAGPHLTAELAQGAGDDARSAVHLKPEFRVCMQVAAPGDQLPGKRFRFGAEVE